MTDIDSIHMTLQRAERIQKAAEIALDYLMNATSDDFERGGDRDVRDALAAALRIDLPGGDPYR